MDAAPTLYTERMILRPLELADAAGIQQQFAHWEVGASLNLCIYKKRRTWNHDDSVVCGISLNGAALRRRQGCASRNVLRPKPLAS
jgi:hypothetical protein